MKLHEVEEKLSEAVLATERYFEGITKLPPLEALRAYAALKAVSDKLGKTMKLLNVVQQHQQYSVMPKIMTDNGIRTHTDDVIRVRFGMSSRWSAKITDKPMAYSWLRENGAGDLIVETVNAQTLGAFAGSYIEERNEDLPDSCFEVKQAKYVTVTKVK